MRRAPDTFPTIPTEEPVFVEGRVVEIIGSLYLVQDPTRKSLALYLDERTIVLGPISKGTSVQALVDARAHALVLAAVHGDHAGPQGLRGDMAHDG